MRAFVAIDLPEEIRTALGRKQAELRSSLAQTGGTNSRHESEIRWSRPEGIHLTLKFLGEITGAQVKQVTDALSVFQAFKTFSVEVKGFGFFPTAARPRVFWAGVAAPPDLARLARRVEDSMEKMSFAREQRDFNPHLTLARFKDSRPHPALRALVDQQNDLSFGNLEVTEFFLFESKLSPNGAEYRKVARFPH